MNKKTAKLQTVSTDLNNLMSHIHKKKLSDVAKNEVVKKKKHCLYLSIKCCKHRG